MKEIPKTVLHYIRQNVTSIASPTLFFFKLTTSSNSAKVTNLQLESRMEDDRDLFSWASSSGSRRDNGGSVDSGQ